MQVNFCSENGFCGRWQKEGEAKPFLFGKQDSGIRKEMKPQGFSSACGTGIDIWKVENNLMNAIQVTLFNSF